MRRLLAIGVLWCAAAGAYADERADAEAAVDAFTHAVATGDEHEALRWLATDVVVYEAGYAEQSRDQYAAEHLKADIAFLRQAKTERLDRQVHVEGPAAWVITRVRMRGEREGKAFDVAVAETMILGKTAQGWRIRHIHWSSRSAAAAR